MSVSVNSPTTIQVSWNEGYELLGWSSFYYIVYYSAYSPDRLQSVRQRFETYNTSLNITIDHLVLEIGWQHQFEVSTVLNVAVEGIETVEGEKSVAVQDIQMGEVLLCSG